MITIQDLIDQEIDLYQALVRVWNEDTQSYEEKGEWTREKMKKYRYLPITAIYLLEGSVCLEVKRELFLNKRKRRR